MKYLIDTNILLEILLGQAHAQKAKEFLRTSAQEGAAVSDFALFSIGIRLFRLQKHSTYSELIRDLFQNGDFRLVSLPVDQAEMLVNTATQYQLDFDDAYHYAIAEYFDLVIVSFDGDFDKTPRGRVNPANIS